MSILIIFYTGKQNGGYNRKLPASLPQCHTKCYQLGKLFWFFTVLFVNSS